MIKTKYVSLNYSLLIDNRIRGWELTHPMSMSSLNTYKNNVLGKIDDTLWTLETLAFLFFQHCCSYLKCKRIVKYFLLNFVWKGQGSGCTHGLHPSLFKLSWNWMTLIKF